MNGDWFVMALMTLNACACVTYTWQGLYVKALYWAAALTLNFCILRMQ